MIKPVILILTLLLLGCNGADKKDHSSASNMEQKKINCVKYIFEKDSIFGNIRNHASEKASLSDAINNYAKNLKSLDFSNCPEDFELAFHKHIEAWLDFRKVSDKYPSLRGELHDIFSTIEKSRDSIEFKSRLNDILETWHSVEQSANR
ncbi:hypothetical protein [Winogradskyella vincentii]|uniref:Lipoprotein n=1 Tax=Winogradskyella vincentii TaxID=2877122 RepID=A0ABS7Y1J8_9FLAO|nr:hypothetical protein [Winogradskyella vincentii]MCA0153757.1 hypothetical protein [Winogradskyella vincentii]